ncbi:MAG: HEAT repeat domain-containing protein [bacterium]
MRRLMLLVSVATFVPQSARPQATLASRVASAPDGLIRMQYDSRTGVCGNGRDVIAFRHSYSSRNMQSYGHWSDAKCVVGPLRVTLTVTNGQVAQMQAQVGGTWPSASAHVTDLGTVPARDAAAVIFSLIPRLETSSETRRGRLLLPAVLADEAPVTAPLLALARDNARRDDTRRDAIHWLGTLGDESVVPALVAFAKRGGSLERDDGRGDEGLASSAVAALSSIEGGGGIPALVDLSRAESVGTRRNAVFWLGQSGDPRAIRTLHTVIENSGEDMRVRVHAIFSLSNSDETPAAQFDYLRSIYARLDDDRLKEAIFQGMAQDREKGGSWLLAVASDAKEPTALRRKAVFWAGQRDGTATADIVKVYKTADSRDMREHTIFVLSQRNDDAATDALIDIAKTDSDSHMRSKALFWLAQKHDGRVSKLLTDILVK